MRAFALAFMATGQEQVEVQPEIVIPGEWLTDKAEHFLFLPFTVPRDIPVDNCKLMSNGEQLLVVVTEAPQQEPETMALRKYKLVLEALKSESGHDEDALLDKLQKWMDSEDDEEVQVHIKAAIDSLVQVRQNKLTRNTRLTLKLGLNTKNATVSFGGTALLARARPHTQAEQEEAEEQDAEKALVSVERATRQGGSSLRVGIIKESFAVEIPYPAQIETIFAIKADDKTIIAGMPLDRHSMEAKGISTGGKPFTRVPVFNPTGAHLAGPFAVLKKLAFGLHLPSVIGGKLKPLP